MRMLPSTFTSSFITFYGLLVLISSEIGILCSMAEGRYVRNTQLTRHNYFMYSAVGGACSLAATFNTKREAFSRRIDGASVSHS
ncbi:hypothetical protein DFH11DRAFT_1234100 [Phellopilus nigrolimitatus]|nr:hypothetical protein DFH11DRAFT_1234100 [Phellopilus nigrolimitatus]